MRTALRNTQMDAAKKIIFEVTLVAKERSAMCLCSVRCTSTNVALVRSWEETGPAPRTSRHQGIDSRHIHVRMRDIEALQVLQRRQRAQGACGGVHARCQCVRQPQRTQACKGGQHGGQRHRGRGRIRSGNRRERQ